MSDHPGQPKSNRVWSSLTKIATAITITQTVGSFILYYATNLRGKNFAIAILSVFIVLLLVGFVWCAKRIKKLNRTYIDMLRELYETSELYILNYSISYEIINSDGDVNIRQVFRVVSNTNEPVERMRIYFSPIKGSITKAEFQKNLSIDKGSITPRDDLDILDKERDYDVFGYEVVFETPVFKEPSTFAFLYKLPKRLPVGIENQEELHIALPTGESSFRLILPSGAQVTRSATKEVDALKQSKVLRDGLKRQEDGSYLLELSNPKYRHLFYTNFSWDFNQ